MGLNKTGKLGANWPKESYVHCLYTAEYAQPTRAGYTRIRLLYQTANFSTQSNYANEIKTRK